jgi:hypothetical protein
LVIIAFFPFYYYVQILCILLNHHIVIYSFRATIFLPNFTPSDLMAWAFSLSITTNPKTKKAPLKGLEVWGWIAVRSWISSKRGRPLERVEKKF